MNLTLLVGILIAEVFVVMLLYLLFGQITVRKLRKNPETKQSLGIEFVSGWDILNVAQALSLPKSLVRKFKKTPLSTLYADTDLLVQYTNTFDRALAKLFYWLFVISGASTIIVVVLNSLGFLD